MNTQAKYGKSFKLAYLCYTAFLLLEEERKFANHVLEAVSDKTTVVDAMDTVVYLNREAQVANNCSIMEHSNSLTVGFPVRLMQEAPADFFMELTEVHGTVRIKEMTLVRKSLGRDSQATTMMEVSLKGKPHNLLYSYAIEFDYFNPSFWSRCFNLCTEVEATGYLDAPSQKLMMVFRHLIQQHG